MSSLTAILNFLEIATCITGFAFWPKIRRSYWGWFPIYLGVIFLIETTAEYLAFACGNVAANIAIYRFFGIPFEFLFLYWLFYRYFKTIHARRWALAVMYIYIVAWLIDLTLVGKMKLFLDSFSYTIGNILLLILLLHYFIGFSRSDDLLYYKTDRMFWVCLGLMIFYLGSLPFHGLRTTLNLKYPGLFIAYWQIQFVLNYLMYGLFIISFVWGKPESSNASRS